MFLPVPPAAQTAQNQPCTVSIIICIKMFCKRHACAARYAQRRDLLSILINIMTEMVIHYLANRVVCLTCFVNNSWELSDTAHNTLSPSQINDCTCMTNFNMPIALAITLKQKIYKLFWYLYLVKLDTFLNETFSIWRKCLLY